MATKKLKVVAAPKLGRGRPSNAKRRAQEASGEVNGNTYVKVATVATAADLIARLRPAIKAIDSVLKDSPAAGADITEDGTLAGDFERLFVDLILALARAP